MGGGASRGAGRWMPAVRLCVGKGPGRSIRVQGLDDTPGEEDASERRIASARALTERHDVGNGPAIRASFVKSLPGEQRAHAAKPRQHLVRDPERIRGVARPPDSTQITR